ncbi:S66 peptidase family protein [Legionella jordanis]|uniref:LD-carboxypeptidase n=1 Tax=Legionella jordanis TaxID=456 RepID=A0A0W0VFF6_9GAMM|nr:LD-carboxypeptidase [Legionella jordanis]KTD18876.1 LD-carboxypeptidase [Legionella jordanis]RMX05553.1 LD-carboxypeptidase [Legionella jordanis]RMX19238.1 LD-carboxypeptidase [Legionella jordanis]VEH12976.1 LD-carboxypeptidase [Legionella jordanis]
MNQLITLMPGDGVEIIAPASRCSDKQLAELKQLLTSWGLNCFVQDELFGQDLLCANSDELRFSALKRALYNPDIKAIVCARGGYGSMRLLPELIQLPPPQTPKLLVGMSDITALHLFLQQHWSWPSLHAALAVDKFNWECIEMSKALMFAEKKEICFKTTALNRSAQEQVSIQSSVCGGNLTLVQTSLGTDWQINAEGKIILLEEVGERGYRVDRMLEQLRQAKVFDQAAALLFADFTEGIEPDGSSLIESVIKRFAETCKIPVFKTHGIGHDPVNFPIPLGTMARIETADNQIVVSI